MACEKLDFDCKTHEVINKLSIYYNFYLQVVNIVSSTNYVQLCLISLPQDNKLFTCDYVLIIKFT